MKVIYVADDGAVFDNEYECNNYELKKEFRNVNSIEMYDKDGKLLKNPEEECTYNTVCRIVIHNEKEIEDLHRIAEYTGFYEYKRINDIGTWVFSDETDRFVKLIDHTFDKFLSDMYLNKIIECQESKSYETSYLKANNILKELLAELGYSEIIEKYEKIEHEFY